MNLKVTLITCSNCKYEKRSLGPLALPAGDLSYWRCFNCGKNAREDGVKLAKISYENYKRVEL